MPLDSAAWNARPEVDRVDFQASCALDPVFHAKYVLGINPWSRQREILRSVRDNPRTAVKSCHASGKSFVAGLAAHWFLQTKPNSIVATTAPTFRQVEKVLWGELRGMQKRALNSGIPVEGRLLGGTEIRIDDKWYAFGFSTDDPDRFQGLHAEWILVILDEASGIQSDLWPGIEGVLSGGQSRLLAIGNPTDPTCEFAREYASLPANARFTISAFDTPNLKAGRTLIPGLVTAEWVADKKKRWGESSPLYLSRVLGQFPPAAPDSLIQLAWIERAQQRWLEDVEAEQKAREVAEELGVEVPPPRGPQGLGCDIAWEGDDFTVFARRRGRRVAVIFEANGLDTMDTAGRIVALAKETGLEPNIDTIGIGAGVYGRVREAGIVAHPMNAAESALDDEKFANRRAEWLWELREAFEEDRIALDPEDTELVLELLAIKYKYSAGRILIEPKAEIKKRIGKSPDRADAIVLAWVKPVARGAFAPTVTATALPMPPIVLPHS